MFIRVTFACLLGLLIGFFTGAYGAEQRCNDLGANCICSEPMNTNNWVDVPKYGSQLFNPADSTTKECNSSGLPGFLEDGSGFRYSVASSGEAINNLPAGHTNTYVLRQLDGGGGQFAGTRFPPGSPTARIAVRFYKYYSTNYGWVGGACLNGNKLAQVSSSFAAGSPNDVRSPVITETGGVWSFYGIETSQDWNQSANGCCAGPGPGAQAGSNVSLASLRGKWVRYEIVIRNAATTGAGTVFEFYRKNVTDNGPNYKYIDSSVPTTFPDGANWTTALATTLHPNKTVDHIVIDWFRNGTCTGFAAISHFLAAAWSTDAGQLIGAAYEIEGGAGSPPPAPTGPTSLNVK